MTPFTVLAVGATGSIGGHVLSESLQAGHRVRALIRDPSRGAELPSEVEAAVGDLTRADTLHEAIEGVDGIVFTHGSHGGAAEAEAVDYGAVCNALEALGPRTPRIALMTTIGVTKHTPGHDWKRRGERLVRGSGGSPRSSSRALRRLPPTTGRSSSSPSTAAPEYLDALFAALRPDPQGALDAVLDRDNMPLEEEPKPVRIDLGAQRDRA